MTRNWPGRPGTATSSRQLLVPRSSAANTGSSSGCGAALRRPAAHGPAGRDPARERSAAGAAPAGAAGALEAEPPPVGRRPAVARKNLAAAPALAPLLALGRGCCRLSAPKPAAWRACRRRRRFRHGQQRPPDAPASGAPAPVSRSSTLFSFLRRANRNRTLQALSFFSCRRQ